jgi:hypothetical protein
LGIYKPTLFILEKHAQKLTKKELSHPTLANNKLTKLIFTTFEQKFLITSGSATRDGHYRLPAKLDIFALT